MSTDANARGAQPTLGHIGGLDGIRALSLLAIIAFHTGVDSVSGGSYGVDSFLVLSEWARRVNVRPGWRVAGASVTIDPHMVPEPALPVVRRADDHDVDAMAAQMAKTFWDDPVSTYVFRDDSRRQAGLRAYFRTQLRADYLPFGGCYTTDGYAGSAIWAPAGKPLLVGLRGIVAMVPVLRYVATNLVTTLRLLSTVEALHPHEPHWYLASLGTAVEQQGKGVGSAPCVPCSRTATRRGFPATSSRPRSATSRSTGATGSRSCRK